ncbi:TPA: hypothetical protein DEP21_02335 [Patescibacteria group bacterium]|nr:hypothetical protein [Candidatus Gracilibacteria bacterium]
MVFHLLFCLQKLPYCIRYGQYLSFIIILVLSLYIHIPFCAQKCAYCSFYTLFLNPEVKDTMIQNYLDTLYKEIEHYANLTEDKHIKTIYLGG